MSRVEARLQELGHSLPEVTAPLAAYVPAVRSGNLVIVSGQVPVAGGKAIATGRVPTDVSVEQAQELARGCVLTALAAVKAEVGDLDRVVRVVRLGCFVACAPDFSSPHLVANGASELLQDIFGAAGKHARAALGAHMLPLNVPVEIEFTFEVRD